MCTKAQIAEFPFTRKSQSRLGSKVDELVSQLNSRSKGSESSRNWQHRSREREQRTGLDRYHRIRFKLEARDYSVD